MYKTLFLSCRAMAWSSDDEDTKRVVRSEKDKRSVVKSPSLCVDIPSVYTGRDANVY